MSLRDKYTTKMLHYFFSQNNCTRSPGICENNGICIPDYATGGSSCECVFDSNHTRCKMAGTMRK